VPFRTSVNSKNGVLTQALQPGTLADLEAGATCLCDHVGLAKEGAAMPRSLRKGPQEEGDVASRTPHPALRARLSQKEASVQPRVPALSQGERVAEDRITTSEGRSATRIVIADVHSVFRYGLRRLLESEPGFHVIGEASSSAEPVKLARQLRPDLVLLGLPLGERAGLNVLHDLIAASPTVRILLVTPSIEKSLVVEALQLGAHGVVRKESPPRVLMESIRTVIDGQYWLARESLPGIVETIREIAPRGNGNGSPRDYGLTPRELALIARVVAGLSNKDVGQELSISERTVKHHLTNIYEKLGISNRLELAVFALNHHLSAPV
jgi:two-component system, NarL family, nitrate/nitrite response regulator NarL